MENLMSRHNPHVILAFADGKRIFWRYVSSTPWNKYDIDGGPMLGDVIASPGISEPIEWLIKDATAKSLRLLPQLDTKVIAAFASGKDVEWRSAKESSCTHDWRVYKGGLTLGFDDAPYSKVEWRIKE
jgi:hypothetical protein